MHSPFKSTVEIKHGILGLCLIGQNLLHRLILLQGSCLLHQVSTSILSPAPRSSLFQAVFTGHDPPLGVGGHLGLRALGRKAILPLS